MWALSIIASFAVSFVLRLQGARQLHFEEAPRLHELVAHLSIAARIPRPHLYVVRRLQPNAFSLGTGFRTASIILTSAALDELDDAELCAMAAHELAHIALGHTRRATLVAALAAVLMRVGAMPGLRGRTLGAVSSRRMFARLHRLGTPLARDLAADRAAARLLGDALGLAALLARLKECSTWGEPVSIADAGTPFTAPTVEGGSLDERIHRLRRMDAEIQGRRAKALLRRSVRRRSRFYPRSRAPHPKRGYRGLQLPLGGTSQAGA